MTDRFLWINTIQGIFFTALGLLFIVAGSYSLWRERRLLIRVEADGCVCIRNGRKTYDLTLEKAVEMTEGFTVYQQVWLLLEMPYGRGQRGTRFVLKADNLEEVLRKVNS